MGSLEEDFAFQEDDHRGAYIFTAPGSSADHVEDDNNDGGPGGATPSSSSRPAKRRKVAGTTTNSASKPAKRKSNAAAAAAPASASVTMIGVDEGGGLFTPLFNGAESPEAVALRRQTYEAAWDGALEERIQRVLREANANTLEEVSSFVQEAYGDGGVGVAGKIPAGFIITGPNIASQDLLFEQLAEVLVRGETKARVVRLRSAGVANLKGALKKIIRDASAVRKTAGGDELEEGGEGEEEEGAEVSVGEDGRKYLDYDLEGLYAFLKTKESRRVVVAFEDSEAFDNGLLTDLIALFHSWQGRIHFSLLFGIATSVELFQARLLKSTAQMLYGAQFDVVQADSVLESVFKAAVAGTKAMIRLGPGLLRSLLERQKDQVAGIHVFISSLKYAYMCHFYANPLSVCLAGTDNKEVEKTILQAQHLQALRTLPSFRSHVEQSVEEHRRLDHAKNLIRADWYLRKKVHSQREKRREYALKLLRCLHLLTAAGLLPGRSFTDIYVNSLEGGISSENPFFAPAFDSIQRLSPEEVLRVTRALVGAIRTGCAELDLPPWEEEAIHWGLIVSIDHVHDGVEELLKEVKKAGKPPGSLRSKYSAQSKVLRTTVVAQKVQLSRDSAALTEHDKKFTGLVDLLADKLAAWMFVQPLERVFLHEVWVYDSKLPYREVFIPRPGMVIDRALGRPHDYLSCGCCRVSNKKSAGEGDGVVASMPAAAILYHLYMEAGSLVNVADLWSAYFALVGGEDGEEEGKMDERTALLHFYRGLAELKAMGFVKGSKKKADHVAKLKWM